MGLILGMDTSNYTTSAAAFDAEAGRMWQVKQLLPVREGEMGLRQSDAVFHHTRQLPEMLEKLALEAGRPLGELAAVAASDRPQQAEGSSMPCFLVGLGAARQLAAVTGKPVYRFTHQQGHVAAALYGAGKLSWLEAPFLAFHVSGGTTDALLVTPDRETVIRCQTVGKSLDLKAGQLIDRVGGMLGLPFPAGPALEKLALKAGGTYRPKPSLQEGHCHLSGVENQCRDMLNKGAPAEEVALFCLMSVLAALEGMTQSLRTRFGSLPLLYAGGVMSNSLLKQALTQRFEGCFAPPVYSADNAAGIAVLGAVRLGGNGYFSVGGSGATL